MVGISGMGHPCGPPCMAASLMLEYQALEQDGSSHSLDTELDGVPMDGSHRKECHTVRKPRVTTPSHVPETMVCRARTAWGRHGQAAEPRERQPVLLLCPWDLVHSLYSPNPGAPAD